jgi:hypothetical protein
LHSNEQVQIAQKKDVDQNSGRLHYVCDMNRKKKEQRKKERNNNNLIEEKKKQENNIE